MTVRRKSDGFAISVPVEPAAISERRPWRTPKVILASTSAETENNVITADDGPSAVS